jgi:hypothetical protein
MTANSGPRTGLSAWFFSLLLCLPVLASAAVGADPTGAQKAGGERFLAAAASGNAQALGQEMHPADLDTLRSRLLVLLRAESQRGDATYRGRLFGPGRSLADLESMTSVSFYAALADRLRIRVREFRDVKWLAAIPDGKLAHVIGRGVPPKEKGSVEVMVLVTLRPWGEMWRATLPTELEAQIDDLLEGRTNPTAIASGGASGNTGSPGAKPAAATPLAPGISELLARAEAAIADGNCEAYYSEFMSPNFQKAISKGARKTLVNACTNNESTRETMIVTLRVVGELQPRYEYEGARAVYDVSGQGLPYSRFVLERVKDRWYIAE